MKQEEMIRLLLPVPGNELKQQREKLHTSLLVLDGEDCTYVLASFSTELTLH